MALKTLVKVGKISNLSDARYCAGMGVDMLGFSVVSGQDQYVSQTLYKEIRGWFSGPQIVAEAYGIQSLNELKEINQNYIPDFIELSIHELPFAQPDLSKFILSITAEEWTNHQAKIGPLKNQIVYLLIPSNTEQIVLKDLAEEFKILVQSDSVSDVETHLKNGIISGINLQGSSEERPGFKSYDELSEIFEKLEVEEL